MGWFDGLGSTVIGVVAGSLLLPCLLRRSTLMRGSKALAAELRFNATVLQDWLKDPKPPDPKGNVIMDKFFLLTTWRTFGAVAAERLTEPEYIKLANLYTMLATTEPSTVRGQALGAQNEPTPC